MKELLLSDKFSFLARISGVPMTAITAISAMPAMLSTLPAWRDRRLRGPVPVLSADGG